MSFFQNTLITGTFRPFLNESMHPTSGFLFLVLILKLCAHQTLLRSNYLYAHSFMFKERGRAYYPVPVLIGYRYLQPLRMKVVNECASSRDNHWQPSRVSQYSFQGDRFKTLLQGGNSFLIIYLTYPSIEYPSTNMINTHDMHS